jgi:hypothetical protein
MYGFAGDHPFGVQGCPVSEYPPDAKETQNIARGSGAASHVRDHALHCGMPGSISVAPSVGARPPTVAAVAL